MVLSRRHTSEAKQEAIELYKAENIPVKEICALTGVSDTALYEILKKAGVERKVRRKYFKKIDQEILRQTCLDYQKKDLPIQEICKLHSVSQSSLRRYMKEQNAELRNKKLSKRYSKEDIELMAFLYEYTDLSIKEICEQCLTNPTTLYRHLVDKKIPFRSGIGKRKLSKEQTVKLLELYKDNKKSLKVREIEKEMGISQGAMRNYVVREGETLRKNLKRKNTQKKMEQAANLHENTNLIVKEIVKKVGIPRSTFYANLSEVKNPGN